MVAKIPPSSFFKGLSNERLKAIFENEGIALEVDWDKRKPERDTMVGEKWIEYAKAHENDANVTKLFEVFQYICVLSKARTNSTNFLEKADKDGCFDNPLPPDFFDLNRTEQAACIYLNEKERGSEVLKGLGDIIYAKDLSYNQDKFVEYQTESHAITVTDEKMSKLKDTLNEFFTAEKKGGNCCIETYPYGTQHYFFGTMDDAKEYIEMKLISDDSFTLKAAIRPYCVIFIFDTDNGKLSIHTPNTLRKDKTDTLAEKILDIFIEKVNKERISKATYDLSCFANLYFAFPVMPVEKVRRIHATKIGFIAEGKPDNEIVICNTKKDDAYRSFIESIGWFQGRNNVNVNNVDFPRPFNVTVIGIQIVMEDDTKINFALQEKSCTQSGHASEEKRKVVEALITKLQIRR